MPSQISIAMLGKVDRNNCRYYVITDPIPANLDLGNAVVLVFPWSEDDKFGADMIIKHRSIQSRRSSDTDDKPDETK